MRILAAPAGRTDVVTDLREASLKEASHGLRGRPEEIDNTSLLNAPADAEESPSPFIEVEHRADRVLVGSQRSSIDDGQIGEAVNRWEVCMAADIQPVLRGSQRLERPAGRIRLPSIVGNEQSHVVLSDAMAEQERAQRGLEALCRRESCKHR